MMLCHIFFFFQIREKKKKIYISVPWFPHSENENFLWNLKFGAYRPITYRNYRKDSIPLPSTRALGTISARNVAPVLIPGRRAPPCLCKGLPQKPWRAKEVVWGIRAAVKEPMLENLFWGMGDPVPLDAHAVRRGLSGIPGKELSSWAQESRHANRAGAKSGCFFVPPPLLSWPLILLSIRRCTSRCDWHRPWICGCQA